MEVGAVSSSFNFCRFTLVFDFFVWTHAHTTSLYTGACEQPFGSLRLSYIFKQERRFACVGAPVV